MRSATWAKWVWLAAGLLAACSDDDSGSVADDGGQDAGTDAGGFIRQRGDTEFGGPCDSTTDCDVGLVCDPQIDVSYDVSGLPLRETSIVASRFPNGVCSPMAAASFDGTGVGSCVPAGPVDEQGCGDDGRCVPISVAGEVIVACRPTCDPSAKKPCGGRFGYTCDFDSFTCVEGCQSNDECRIKLEDADGDGEADALAYDDESEASCDSESFRCVHDGSGGGTAGDACARIDECEGEGLCLDPLQTFAGFPFPGGYCTKLGCDQPGRECDRNAVCQRLRPLRTSQPTEAVCLASCEVGAEPAEDQVGPNGHGMGCRDGYACHYNGGEGSDGVCVGGNYNAVTENNIGGSCESDADCFSPFGRGACLMLAVGDVSAPSGVCSLLDCAAPGLPADVCGSGNDCIGLDGDVTFCVQTCGKADVCPTGFACVDDDESPVSPNICFPACFGDADCRETEVCRFVDAIAGYGSCVASGR